MIEFFRKLFSNDFMPHGMCYLWDPAVLWLNVAADLLIAAAYYAIPFLLFRFTRRRRDISFNWIFVAFGMFILACGTTHLMAAVTVWNPVYRLDGVIKAVTAAASVATFLLLIPMVPTLVSLPSPSQLASVNASLAGEIEERRAAEAQVRIVNEELEERVLKRTAEQELAAQSLKLALDDLRQEMRRRHELEDQLVHSQKMEAVGRLAGGVAHDFNNLLTVILGYTEMLRERVQDDPTAADFAQEVLRASERASALTNQLLAFSRRQVVVARVVDLNEMVRQIEKMLCRMIGEDIQLQLLLDPALPPVKVDSSQMDQVIMNLAVNARDAMPRGGTLTIATAPVEIPQERAENHPGMAPGPYATLAVSDTGMGMDAATRSRIFEPFFTTKEQGKGTGLGLSIVYGVVKQNDGEILVNSEPGRGSVFTIYLPAVAAPVDALPAGTEETGQEPATETILLVEDEEQVRSLTRTMLERRGYCILDAGCGADALRLVERHHSQIDLLLTDIVMPQMSGTDLARRVTAAHPEIKVLFMSGYTDARLVDQAMITADTQFIPKPFSQTVLQKKVREVLRG